MIQFIIAAWALSAVLVFLPVGPVARLIGRRLRPASRRPAPEPPEPAAEFVHSQPEELEVPVAVAEPPDAAASEQEPPSPAPAPDEEAPAAPPVPPPVALRNRALGLFGSLATVALCVLFVVSSVYLAPRLLVRILDNEHPVAAITPLSM